MGTIRFIIRKDRTDKDGFAPIHLIYQISGQRKFYPAGQKVTPENWDDTSQEAVYFKLDEKGKKVLGKLMELEVKKINNKLQDLKRDVEKIESRFEANGIIYTPDMVLEELKQKGVPVAKKGADSKEVYAFIDKYITDHENTRVKGSLSVYKSLKSHLQDYEKRSKTKITFEKIDYSFFQAFQNFLVSLTIKNKEGKQVKRLNNVTIAKQLSTLKTFLGYAQKSNIEVPASYRNFTVKRENDLEVIALTRPEFEALQNMNLTKKQAWDAVRDAFIVSCVTSYRYSDLKQMQWHHINFNEGFVQLSAVKTGHTNKVPLTPIARAIFKKYEGSPRPLQVISNQRMNEHLKKICDWAGINTPVEIVRKYGAERVVRVFPKSELIGMHCGRKTFASLSLEAGMSAEYVMRVGGWKSYASFKRYMNLSDDATQEAMLAAWGGKVVKTKLKAV